ncbi:helix-turn-helix domain-containing protein [Methylosinus sp. C49]|uniref:GlxA family transcriptional regulator n=1 Tax=Methylosinus sp. C49 TaxID=2699395 RepID=UPI0018D73F2F|nr:helix-turn-helix domain-containing protein [Methylosinus sp. C49]
MIALLIFEEFQILDAAGPIAAFEIAARIVPGAYTLRTIAAAPGLVRSSSGVAIAAGGLAAARRCDTLLIAGGLGTRGAAMDRNTLAFVARAATRARRVASVCSGAYVLAAAGLLDGRRATTHWSRSGDFQRRFPKVRLEPDLIFVHDGPIWSSAGITAGIDLALAMIDDDLGEDVARAVARQLVVYHRRPGGQSQFSALLELESRQDKFATLLRWASERLRQRLTVEELAAQAAMSPRNFARAFSRATGATPAKAIERLRLDRAKSALENGADTIEQIARDSGFRDPERMRRAFLRVYGQPPQAFRRGGRL